METWHFRADQRWYDLQITIPMRDVIDRMRTKLDNPIRNRRTGRIAICKEYEFVIVNDHEFISAERYMDDSCLTITYRLMKSSTGD